MRTKCLKKQCAAENHQPDVSRTYMITQEIQWFILENWQCNTIDQKNKKKQPVDCDKQANGFTKEATAG